MGEGQDEAPPPHGRSGASEAALAYDRWFEMPWGRYAFSVEAAALHRALGPLSGLKLLDVGCGTGRFTAAFEQWGARVTAVDTDTGRLAVASGRIRGEVLDADAQHLPFDDGAFDVVTATAVLEFVPDPRQAVSEMARVTGPWGRLLIGALNPRSPWGAAHRHSFNGPPWRSARFLSRAHLAHLAAPYGKANLDAALFSPGWFPGLEQIGPGLELVGRHFLPALGAFQILALDRHAT
ncbi:class I SAM-dependent methyltransferase [Sinomonas sp. RB5]